MIRKNYNWPKIWGQTQKVYKSVAGAKNVCSEKTKNL